jgi:hypothetical protein
MADPTPVQIPAGHVVITTYGQITQQTAACLSEARSLTEKQGLHEIAYRMESGTLVEQTRNNAARALLRDPKAQWLLFIDGDTTFAPDALLHMLHTAYVQLPAVSVVGGYVPLRGDLALPTIDTGTGTWESWFPGSGTIDVIRTGCAFLLIKRHVFEHLKDPWFRVRIPARPLDFMLEVDNFARTKFDGRNPMREASDAWERLEKCARDDPSSAPEHFTPVGVGEDSGFCDRARNAGFRVVVNTDIECGHVDHRVLTAADHKKACVERERAQRLLCGITA